MKFKALIGTSILAMAVATPAWAQDPAEEVERDAFGGEIVVTAQRQSERLQDVPLVVVQRVIAPASTRRAGRPVLHFGPAARPRRGCVRYRRQCRGSAFRPLRP